MYAHILKLMKQMLQVQTLLRAIVHDLGFGFTTRYLFRSILSTQLITATILSDYNETSHML